MEDHFKQLVGSLKSDTLALAFVGALIAQSFWPSSSSRKAAVAVLIGTIIAGVTAPAIVSVLVWKWPGFPEAVKGAVYFWTGLMGMQTVPVVAFLLNKLKKSRLPGGDPWY